MVGFLGFFAKATQLSQLHNPQPESWLVGSVPPIHRAFMDITFDRTMTISLLPVDPAIWKAWINDVPQVITYGNWQSPTVLRVAITYDIEDADVFKLQLPKPDPSIYDSDGCLCLGFQPISDTYIVAKSPLLSFGEEVIDYSKFEQEYKIT